MRRTGETVFLGTLAGDGLSVVYIDKVESEQIIRYAAGVGDRRPLHATSSGKAILAFLPPEQREKICKALPLVRHTERTVTSLAALDAALDEIQRAGVCVSLDEMVRGRRRSGRPDLRSPVAGRRRLCDRGPDRPVRPQARRLAGEAKRTALAISALLGYRAVDDRKSTGRTS